MTDQLVYPHVIVISERNWAVFEATSNVEQLQNTTAEDWETDPALSVASLK